MSCDFDEIDDDVEDDVGTTDDDKEDTSRFGEGDEDKLSQYVEKTSCEELDIGEKPIKG